jgi:Concanavalin A-like lectin/glucanases superfamily
MPLIGRIASAAARGYGLFANIVQAAVDPYFNYVVALLHGDGTNGGQNNTFLDSSTNNFTITRNGNTTQGSFSPFSQTGWSNYFDGNGDYLTTPTSTVDLSTNQFTLECWVYFNSLTATTSLFGTRTGDATNTIQWSLLVDASASYKVYFSAYSTSNTNICAIPSDAGLVANQWYHIAATRDSSNVIKLWVNGVAQSTTVTSSAAIANSVTSVKIGMMPGSFGGTGGPLNGYLSNVRIVNGTAVYTSNFTVPTTPLTAITNTSLLTCQSNRFRDASTNNFTITRNGDVSVQPFSPFNPTTAYSASSIGGSGYFDGSGDYLTVPDSTAFTMGTGDFSVECWYYGTSSSRQIIVSQSNNGGTTFSFWLEKNASNQLRCLATVGGVQYVATATATMDLNAWNFLQLVKSGTTLYGYQNGTQVCSVSVGSGSLLDSTDNVTIGDYGAGSGLPVVGYISSVRILKGTASTATVPTSPLTAITNTSLLLNFTNGAIFDNAAVADYETVGNAQISTSVKKYGTGSLAFDGTGDWLLTKATTPFDLGTGDMTFECWFYITNTIADYRMLASDATNGNNYICLRGGGTGGQIEVNVNGTSFRFNLSNTVSQNTWTHLAVVRIGSTWIAYINGLSLGTNTSSGSFNLGNGGMYVGRFGGATAYEWPGYIDDLRITKGIARYPYNFTPPTAALPDIGGTVTLTADPYYEYTTLLLPGNGTNGAQNNTFLDSSTNNFTITRNGNTTQGSFSPFSQTGWGNYFDGSGDYLTSSIGSISSGASFTFEFWAYFTGSLTANVRYFDLNSFAFAAQNLVYRVSGVSTGSGAVEVSMNGSQSASSTNVVKTNSWQHHAISYNGTTLSIWVDGTRVISYTPTAGGLLTSIAIGSSAAAAEYFTGYISNFRLVIGSTVYTPSSTTITVPTTPLTAISGTSLLTCQANRFLDASSNAYTITRNGDVSVQPFSPFNPTASWSAATYGGSGYFDGSGDYLSGPNDAAVSTSGGNYLCCEAWVYPTSHGSERTIFFRLQLSGSYPGYILRLDNGFPLLGSSSNDLTSSTAAQLNAWNHVAFVFDSSGNQSIYLNGVRTATRTNGPTTMDYSTNLIIGGDGTGTRNFFGYIAGARIIKQSTAYYSGATITVPTAPPTAVTNTSLLLNFTNAGIYDATSKNDLETVGNAQISTTQSKFGGSSMYLTATTMC